MRFDFLKIFHFLQIRPAGCSHHRPSFELAVAVPVVGAELVVDAVAFAVRMLVEPTSAAIQPACCLVAVALKARHCEPRETN